jgi:small subunit ribosomal protein S3
MGQKIHPVGLRLGITRTWDSRWYEKKQYTAWLHEDVAIRKYLGRLTRAAAISKVEIERRANQARVIVHTAKPGIIIGKRGVGIEDIRKSLERMTQKNVQVNVIEIKHPELDARLVAQNIVDQLEKRIAFRRAMKQAIMRTMKAGARGVKVQVSGRLGGSEIARSEQNHDGKVPLHTLRADIDYAHVEAFTTFGRIGTKVWIYKGEVLPEGPRGEARAERAVPAGERAQFRDRRGRRGGRGGAQRPVPGAPATSELGEVTEPTTETATDLAAPAPATELAGPAPATELAAPAPATELAGPARATELAAPAPATELAAPAAATELAAPAAATELAAPAAATELAAPAAATELAAPAPATELAAPVASTELASSAPSSELVTPEADVTPSAPSTELVTPEADVTPSAPLAAFVTSEPEAEVTPSAPSTEVAASVSAELPLPSAAEILHDHASLQSATESAPPIAGEHPTGPHGGSVVHSVPPAGMESVADATPVEAIEHDVAALPEGNAGEANE